MSGVKINSAIEFTVTRVSLQLDNEGVKVWRELLITIRGQCHLLSQIVAQRQLLLIAQCITLATICSYFIANVNWSLQVYRQMMPMWLYLCLSNLGRISRKALVAERITIEEHAIATRLALIKLKRPDFRTLHEIKMTYDIIANNPIRIQFGSYIHFNRRVVLTILNQVVTYIIVLMQFG
ncbi:unnamed protein product [Allacma fusca]|uniref:Gustatory receptor n=1 Tax=Allacma fusca TaxID=39272 RepID=A0A8J2J6J7_9HEXA|nr:unnamed protein product [Allacma fusca]